MRHVAQALLSAAVLVVAGCSLFRDSDVRVAEITSIGAPDTVNVGMSFNLTFTALLGPDGGYVLDHLEAYYTDAQVALRVWSRNSRPDAANMVIVYRDLTFEARPLEPGSFLVIAHQPDGSTTEKTITVLP